MALRSSLLSPRAEKLDLKNIQVFGTFPKHQMTNFCSDLKCLTHATLKIIHATGLIPSQNGNIVT